VVLNEEIFDTMVSWGDRLQDFCGMNLSALDCVCVCVLKGHVVFVLAYSFARKLK